MNSPARGWLTREEDRRKRAADELRRAAVGQTCRAMIEHFPDFAMCGRPATGIAYGDPWGLNNRFPAWRCRRCWYREYLKSGHWERLRERILRRSNWKCERCGERAGYSMKGNKIGLQVHHLSYERVGYEHDDDLIVLCFACHAKEHGRSA